MINDIIGRPEVCVYLSLGSNMGNRKENLKKALCFLSERTRLEKLSSVYDTAPVGNENQPRFLNMVPGFDHTPTGGATDHSQRHRKQVGETAENPQPASSH